jgi:hypothetical protein
VDKAELTAQLKHAKAFKIARACILTGKRTHISGAKSKQMETFL